MNGRGCKLMVSPSGVDQTSSPSLHPGNATPGNAALLPALSLRRQVLTNGKLGFPQSSQHQAAQFSLPACSSKQTVRPCCPDNGTKGYLSLGPDRRVFGPCRSSNLQVTSNPTLLQSLGPVSPSVPQMSLQNGPAHSLTVPFSDARSLLSRESLASTTLSLAETQSIRSSKLDWPYGYRVLPPLGLQTTTEITDPSLTAAMTQSESVPNPPCLPQYLFRDDGSSPRLSSRAKKRALSLSPLSDGIDLNSIIRTSPTSLVAYIIGSRSSPASHASASPLQPDACGHLLGIRGSCILHPGTHTSTSLHGKVTQTSRDESGSVRRETSRMRELEATPLEDRFTNLVVGHQLMPEPYSLSPSIQLQLELSAVIGTSSPPRGPPPPYSAHTLCPTLEEDEDEDAGLCCCWTDCGAVFGHRDELVKHIEKSHVDQRKGDDFTCFWAGCPRQHKPFNARYKLLIHMRVHSGEKPNRCSFEGCQKAFSRLENLKIHLRSHTGEKPYVCQQPGCTKAFSNSSDRAKHTRTHTDTKPYGCQIQGCGKRYTDPSSLRKHLKSHAAREQQARKKLRRSSDLAQDGLRECLTVQPLQHSLAPQDLIETQHQSPIDELYTVFPLNQPSRTNAINSPMQITAGPQTRQNQHNLQSHQTHPSPNGPQMPLPPLQGNNRFRAAVPLQTSFSPRHRLNQNSHNLHRDAGQPRPAAHNGFCGDARPVFSYSPAEAKHVSSCFMMQTPVFEDSLASSDVSQPELTLLHRNAAAVFDCQSGPEVFLGEQASEDNYLQILRSPSRISCVFTEG